MKITFFVRNPKDGISIGRVFNILSKYITKKEETKFVIMEHGGASLKQILRNLIYTYRYRNKNGINHITGAIHYLSFVLPKSNTITTVHDLGMIYNKDNNISPLRKFLLYILIIIPLYHNKKIICVSEKTKQILLSHSKLASNKVYVIPDPVSDDFRYTPKPFNEECPIILHIGTGPNKNLIRTIEAIKDLNVKLRIIGELPDLERKLLETYKINFTNACNLSNQEIVKEYNQCDIVNFVSTYEGFGMPIIEAQAVGRVCITSKLEPMQSVANQGALLVDPFNIQSIKNSYIEIIQSPTLRERLIAQGIINCKRFKAETIAESYIKIYNEIIND